MVQVVAREQEDCLATSMFLLILLVMGRVAATPPPPGTATRKLADAADILVLEVERYANATSSLDRV